MDLRSLMLIPLLGGALAFGQDEDDFVSREPIWRRAQKAAERSIEQGDKVGARKHLIEALRWKPGRSIEGLLLERLIEN